MEKDILLLNERKAVNFLKRIINQRNVPIKIYRASPCRGVGENRSVYLYKWNDQSGWIQGMKFWDGNHQERCDYAILELQNYSNQIEYIPNDNCYCHQDDKN